MPTSSLASRRPLRSGSSIAAVALAASVLLLPSLAAAHTGAAGSHAAFAGGYASGFLHPLGGLDHLLAMVSVGLFAALLGAMLYGIEGQMEAPTPLTGNAYTQELPSIPTDWKDAIAAFAEGRLMQNIFDPLLIDNLVRTKRQEQAHMDGFSRAEIADLYLTRA